MTSSTMAAGVSTPITGPDVTLTLGRAGTLVWVSYGPEFRILGLLWRRDGGAFHAEGPVTAGGTLPDLGVHPDLWHAVAAVLAHVNSGA